MTTEFQDRLINVAQRKGYLDADKARAALQLLKEAQEKRRGASLHAVLLESKLLTREQLVDVRRSMAREGMHYRVGDYELLSRIGRGAIGTVYRARQRSLDRIVALKILSSHLASDEESVKRFLREAQLAARVSHPNVVQVFDVGQWRATRYIAMEYVHGRSLERVLSASGPISEELAVSVACQIAAALGRAAEQGVVHRDIKPGNILLTPDGTAKLADLGLALAAGETSEENVGTPYYMSPEQTRNDANLDARSDIYSLGCALFHAVTGRPPFDGATAVETLRMHAEQPPPDARTIRPELSPAFSAVLLRMMAKRPEDRFRTPSELLAALEPLRGPAISHPRARTRMSVLWFVAFAVAGAVLLILLIMLASTLARAKSGSP